MSGMGFTYAMPYAMVPDAIEYDYLETGERTEGAFYGIWTFCFKIGQALALGTGSAPDDPLAVAGDERTRTVGSRELRQERKIPSAIGWQVNPGVRWPLVNALTRKRPSVEATPQGELVCHRFDYYVFDHDVFHGWESCIMLIPK